MLEQGGSKGNEAHYARIEEMRVFPRECEAGGGILSIIPLRYLRFLLVQPLRLFPVDSANLCVRSRELPCKSSLLLVSFKTY